MDSGVYPASAVERAMKVQELIVRAIDGRVKWYQAAEILGISDRQMRRWKVRYECGGYDGLFDRRRQRPSPKRVPLAMVREVLTLYRERYFDCNVLHFHEKLQAVHGIPLSYTWVKTALQTAGWWRRRRAGAPTGRRGRGGRCPGCSCTRMRAHMGGSPTWAPRTSSPSWMTRRARSPTRDSSRRRAPARCWPRSAR